LADYIAIDSGTTNTRISLVVDYKVIDTMTFNVGAKKGIDNKEILKDTLKSGIKDILMQNNLSETDVECILACGMITSEFGLIELPHIHIPAGVEEMHKNICKCSFEDITNIPFVFIRGVKTQCTKLENTDMMRSEESEVIGIFEGEGIYILPGSHTKVIKVNDAGQITDFKTMLTGEMISAITQGTILKDAVKLGDFEPDKEYLIKGFEYANDHGISEALFRIRSLKNFFSATESEIYNFFMGVMLCDEIKYTVSEKPKKAVIGGRKAIKEAIAILLKEFTDAEVIILTEEQVKNSTTVGMIKIYENRS